MPCVRTTGPAGIVREADDADRRITYPMLFAWFEHDDMADL
jgi:hypothetical protein